MLAQSESRSYLMFENLSAQSMWLEFGSARATCTISGGTVNGTTITNAGFNFTKAPVVRFLGGGGKDGPGGNSSYLGLNQPNGPTPSHPAAGHCVMTGSAGALTVASITIDDPGANYLCAPYVFIFNDDLDPYGCAVPAANSGLLLVANGGSFVMEGTTTTTDPVSVFCTTTSSQFCLKWMD